MSKQFDVLQLKEVIALDSETAEDLFKETALSRTIKVEEIIDAIADGITNGLESDLLTDGLTCEVLQLNGKGWQPGKIRVRIEFCPDEPVVLESPLDELRTTLSATN